MKRFNRYLGHFLAFLMALMLISVCWQVITRYFMSSASSYTDELARYLLIWIGMLGAAYASGQGMHLAIDLLPTKLKGRSKDILGIFIYALIILFASTVMIAGGVWLVYITYSLGQVSAAMQIPLAYVYAILPISGVLIVMYKIREIMLLLNKDSGSNSSSISPS